MLNRLLSVVVLVQVIVPAWSRSRPLEIMFSQMKDPELLDLLRAESMQNAEPPSRLPPHIRKLLWNERVEAGLASGPLPTPSPPAIVASTSRPKMLSPIGDPANPRIPEWMRRVLRARHTLSPDVFDEFDEPSPRSAFKSADLDKNSPPVVRMHARRLGHHHLKAKTIEQF